MEKCLRCLTSGEVYFVAKSFLRDFESIGDSMALDPLSFPEQFFDFAFVPHFDDHIQALKEMAEPEEWNYKHTPNDKPYPVLRNYIRYTYARLAQEKKIAVAEEEDCACFNTGLITTHQEQIFMLFSQNRLPDSRQYWHFWKFARKGERELNRFSSLPAMAHYFDDPSCLVFDTRRELRANIEHIVSDNRDRFPDRLKEMNSFGVQNLIKGAIDSAKERVQRNYKTAIPQFYGGTIQLLLPLCLTEATQADLALVVERFPDFYRAATCLTLDMAYNNARQLARPDRDWLEP